MDENVPVSAIEAIEKALAKVEFREWFAGGVTDEGLTVVDDGLSHGIFPIQAETHEANFIAACNPVAMRQVLALARQAEALTGIDSAHDLISDWLGEGTDDLPDETPVRVEIGKRTIIVDNLGSLRRARALLGGENAGN